MHVKITNILEGKRFTKICFKNNKLFPDGKGGQLGDRGYIDGEYFSSVERYENHICVSLKTEPHFNVGDLVKLDIDLDRRYDIAQQHTAQHLLSAIISKEFNSETKAFKMGEEYSTIDIELPLFEKEHIELAERLFFIEVKQCRKVSTKDYPFKSIKDKDLRKPIKDKLSQEESIRIVSIDGIDKIACSGFHVSNSGELGLLKIIKIEKKKSNITRLYFVAGFRALSYFQAVHNLVRWLNNKLTSGMNELPEKIKKMEENIRTLKKQNNEIQDRIAKVYSENAIKDNSICKYVEAEKSIVEKIHDYVDSEEYILIGKIEENKYMMYSKNIDLFELYSYLSERLKITGGCGKTKGQIITHNTPKELLESIKDFLREE